MQKKLRHILNVGNKKTTLNTRDEGPKIEININDNNLKHQGRGAESERGHRAWLQVHHVEAGEPGQVLCFFYHQRAWPVIF